MSQRIPCNKLQPIPET